MHHGTVCSFFKVFDSLLTICCTMAATHRTQVGPMAANCMITVNFVHGPLKCVQNLKPNLL
jgi:hypothetical protein